MLPVCSILLSLSIKYIENSAQHVRLQYKRVFTYLCHNILSEQEASSSGADTPPLDIYGEYNQ